MKRRYHYQKARRHKQTAPPVIPIMGGVLPNHDGILNWLSGKTVDNITITNSIADDVTNKIHARAVHRKVFNNSGGTLTTGTPVYITGYNAGQDAITVDEADADNSAKMPAVGIIEKDISNGSTGEMVITGLLEDYSVPGTWSVGDAIYVSRSAGNLTNDRPGEDADAVQKMGIVMKTGANGRLFVFGAGRSNDVPNKVQYRANSRFFMTGGEMVQRSTTGTVAIASLTGFLQVTLGALQNGVWQWIIRPNQDMGFFNNIREIKFYYTLSGTVQISSNRWYAVNIETGGVNVVDNDTTAITSGTSHSISGLPYTMSDTADYIVGEITVAETSSGAGIVQLRAVEVEYDNTTD